MSNTRWTLKTLKVSWMQNSAWFPFEEEKLSQQRFLALPDLLVCVAFEWCSMEELLCPENRSCGEAALQKTVAKDKSYFRLMWSDPFGSLDCNSHSVQTENIHSLIFFLAVFCPLKICFSAPLMAFIEVLRNPFPLWFSRGSSLSLVRRKPQSVLPCPGQDPAHYWDIITLLRVLFYPLTPWASSEWV